MEEGRRGDRNWSQSLGSQSRGGRHCARRASRLKARSQDRHGALETNADSSVSGQRRCNMCKGSLMRFFDMNEPSVDDPLTKQVDRTDMAGEDFDPKAARDTTKVTGKKG